MHFDRSIRQVKHIKDFSWHNHVEWLNVWCRVSIETFDNIFLAISVHSQGVLAVHYILHCILLWVSPAKCRAINERTPTLMIISCGKRAYWALITANPNENPVRRFFHSFLASFCFASFSRFIFSTIFLATGMPRCSPNASATIDAIQTTFCLANYPLLCNFMTDLPFLPEKPGKNVQAVIISENERICMLRIKQAKCENTKVRCAGTLRLVDGRRTCNVCTQCRQATTNEHTKCQVSNNTCTTMLAHSKRKPNEKHLWQHRASILLMIMFWQSCR